MAKCKVCKTYIPDGTEYCDDCQDKGSLISNESYLDSLLNSVKNTAPTAETVYKKKNKDITHSPETDFKTAESDQQDFSHYDIDVEDIEDFLQFNLKEDLDEISNDIVIGDKELFGEDLSEFLSGDMDGNEINITSILPERSVETEDKLEQKPLEENITEEFEPFNTPSDLNLYPDKVQEFKENDDIDSDLNDLLNGLGLGLEYEDDNTNFVEQEKEEVPVSPEPVNENFNQHDSEDEDIMNLLNQISSDDPVAEDVKAIHSILNGEPVMPTNKDNMPSDVGEVFSDALKVVTSLNDPDMNEFDLLNSMSEKEAKKSKKNKKNKKASRKDKVIEEADTVDKPKKSLSQRLFGNVKDEKAKKKDQSNNEESAATQEVKKAKRKKGKNAEPPKDEEELPNGTKDVKGRPADKKEKKDNKKKTKEIIQVIDELDEDEGRINRLGAVIVFIFFGLLAMLLYVGTNAVSYTLSIQNATSYFDKQKYTQAYNEVYGMDIKDEDIEIYDKIQTVMFVNKQLNSYNNYYAMGKHPEALDSLLKGLKRYDKYIELATMLGIKTDLDYVREQILAELNEVYNLSEKEAIQLNSYDDMIEYSLEVYDIVFENMSN